jgi:hypothetical protein
MSGVVHTYYVWSVFMCNWCLEFLRLIVSSLSSCVSDVWSCSYLLCLVCVHVYLMSGVAQTYYVLSEFMCKWCLEWFIFIMSGLCSCVTDVWIVSSVFMCFWCLELLRLIVSSLSSCVADVWTSSDLLCPSVFMCSWCLELLRLIVSSLSSCVTDVWSCSDLFYPLWVHL